ncbi:MAG: ABC transporter ATP-binding protein [Myxococcota bacterium]|jgi:ABC-2 type transport system ATP-binding protein|nr:ABC transporter ATP-binding protein [Myxococcota bacterium]
MSELVQLRGLRVVRGQFSLKVQSLSVGGGEVLGVVGPNAAGKTTLLELLAGMLGAEFGMVQVFQLDPFEHPAQVRSRLGYMSDDLPVFDLKLSRLMEMISRYYPTWDWDLCRKLLRDFDLSPSDRPSKLSKGEGTKLRLVLAMSFRPKVLLLDEPATGLDLGGRRKLLEYVLRTAGEEDRCVIISSHQLADIERIADKLLVLNNGTVIKQGMAPELIGEGRTLEEALIAWGAAG